MTPRRSASAVASSNAASNTSRAAGEPLRSQRQGATLGEAAEGRLQNGVGEVAAIPRVDHQDPVRLLDRLQTIDALEKESERADRVALERGRREGSHAEIDALAEEPVVDGERVRPLARPDRLEAAPGTRQLA